MKKNLTKLLMLLGVFLLLGAKPVLAKDYYNIYGNIFSGNWEPKPMTEKDNGYWVCEEYTVNNAGNFGIRVSSDAAGNNQTSWIASSDNNTTIKHGKEMSTKTDGETWYIDNNKGTYTFVYNTNTKKLITAPTMYLLLNTGDGWNLKDKSHKLKYDYTTNTYSIEYTIQADNTYFLFAEKTADSDDPWNDIREVRYQPKGGDLTPSFTNSVYNGDIELGTSGTYNLNKGTYKFTISLNDLNIKIENLSSSEPSTPTIPDLYIMTTDNSNGTWNMGGGAKMTSPTTATGDYTYNLTIKNQNWAHLIFSTKLGSGSDWNSVNGSRYVPSAKSDVKPLFTSATKSYSGNIALENSGSFVLQKGQYTITVNLSKNTVKIVANSVDPIDEYYYLCGKDIIGSDNPTTAMEQDSSNPEIWSIKLTPQKASGEFWVTRKENGEGKNWYKNGSISIFNRSAELSEGGNDNATFSLDANTEYTFYFNSSSRKFSFVGGDAVQKSNVYLTFGSDNHECKVEYLFNNTGDNNKKVLAVALDAGTYNVKLNNNGEKKGFVNPSSHGNGYQLFDSNSSKELGIKLSKRSKVYFEYLDTYGDGGNDYNAIKWSVEELPSPLPQSLYIYGHINKGSWDRDNKEELIQINPGVYELDNVLIEGRWNHRDYTMAGGRTIWAETGKYCYVAFYDNVQTKADFDANNSGVFKFGSYEPYNNFDYVANENRNGNFLITENVWEHMSYQTERERSNFVVPKGTYTVTVDLNKGTVKFSRKETVPTPHTYRWYVGDADHKYNANPSDKLESVGEVNGVPHHKHTLFVGDDNIDVVQVGVNGFTQDPAARQVSYKIGYKGASKSDNVAKRRVDTANGVPSLPAGYEENVKVTYQPLAADNDGTYGDLYYEDEQLTEETADPGCYTIIGSSSPSDNHLIRLNKVGEYYIVAYLDGEPSQYQDMDHISEMNPSTLLVTVAANEVKVTMVNTDSQKKFYQPFDLNNGNIVLSEGISLDTEVPADELVVTLTPVNVSTWATGENTEDDYETGLNVEGSTLYQQWLFLGGTQAQIDGFYTAGETITGSMTYKSGSNYSYDINLPVPCSGVYNMNITTTSGSKYGLSNESEVQNLTVEIYPYLYGTFGTAGVAIPSDYQKDGKTTSATDQGFNVEGYTFVNGDGGYMIAIPENAKWSVAKAFIPGTYFVDALTIGEGVASGANNVKRRTASKTSDIYYAEMDLTNWTSGNYPFNVTVKKNGATGIYNFTLTRSSSTVGSTTGVDAIGAEADGEAIYYNLQGVKVQNPEKGIYVKVQNGQATKVVL